MDHGYDVMDSARRLPSRSASGSSLYLERMSCRYRLIPILLAAAFAAQATASQTAPQTLFPGLTDEPLREAIAEAYAPVDVLSLDESKDTLYAVVDREERGGVAGAAGIYTDYFVPFDCVPNCDPSQDVYNGGPGLSQEHTWPRSEGAGSGLFERDLHHLFPARNAVNGARGNLPFGESPDDQTSTWYYLDGSQSTAPPEDERDRGEVEGLRFQA